MDAKVALKNDHMVVLIYSHDKREISIEDGDVVTVEEAKKLFDRALVADCNASMTRLCLNDYDMDAVEVFYRESDV